MTRDELIQALHAFPFQMAIYDTSAPTTPLYPGLKQRIAALLARSTEDGKDGNRG